MDAIARSIQGGDRVRLIDAECSELQTQLKIIREAEYQIYGSGSWGFTAKCEHAIEDAPTIQPEPHWIPVTERLPDDSRNVLITSKSGVSMAWYNGLYFEKGASTHHRKIKTVTAWRELPEPYKEVIE